MKKTGKILGMFLSAAMLCGSLVCPVSAEETDGINFTEKGLYATSSYTFANTDANSYVAITREHARTGDYALYIKHVKDRSPSMQVKFNPTTDIKLTAGVEYTLEFWVKGNFVYPTTGNDGEATTGSGWFFFGPGINSEQDAKRFSSGNTITEVKDGEWTKYEKKFTPTEDWTYNNYLLICDAYADVVVDDFKLYKTAEPNTNLFADGGFEEGCKDNPIYDEEGLSTSNFETYYNNISSDNTWAKITKKYARTGKYALFIHRGEQDRNNKQFRVLYSQDNIEIPAGKKYFVEYWVKGCWSMGTSIITCQDWNTLEWINSDSQLIETYENGWKHYRKEYTAPSDKSVNPLPGKILIDVDAACNYVIDDFKVYTEDAPEVNLLLDGGFENSIEVDTTTPINLLAAPGLNGDTMTVTWTNPSSSKITDYKLYIEGEEDKWLEVDDFTPKTTALTANEYKFTRLSTDCEYRFKLEETVDGKVYTFYASGVTDSKGQYTDRIGNYTSSWVLNRSTSGFAPNVVASLDTENKASGTASVKIDCNIPTRGNNWFNTLQQKVTLPLNKKYRLTFKYKSAGTKYAVVEDLYDNRKDFLVKQDDYGLTTDGWQSYSYDLYAGSGYYDIDSSDTLERTINFKIEESAGTLWIDDVELKAIDEWDETQTEGVNLLADGGFDFEPYEVKDVVFEKCTTDSDGNVTETEAISEIGTEAVKVKATAAVSNMGAGNDFKAAVVFALYNGGQLEKVQVAERTVPEKGAWLAADEFTAYIDVPKAETGDDYKIKVMYWNGFDKMSPLDGADVLK